MPLYCFICTTCKKETEELMPHAQRPAAIKCECGGEAVYSLSPTQFTVNGANAANRYAGESNYKWIGGDE